MFMGMDVHKNYLQVAVLNEKGKVLSNSSNSRVDNNPIKVNKFFDRNPPMSKETLLRMHTSGYRGNIQSSVQNVSLESLAS